MLKYAERRNRDSLEQYSIRQTAVYCDVRNGTDARSRWMFFHPSEKSVLQKKVEDMAKDSSCASRMITDPLALHAVFLATFISNWQEYLLDIEKRLINLVCRLNTRL